MAGKSFIIPEKFSSFLEKIKKSAKNLSGIDENRTIELEKMP